jgi:hypothetical protein
MSYRQMAAEIDIEGWSPDAESPAPSSQGTPQQPYGFYRMIIRGLEIRGARGGGQMHNIGGIVDPVPTGRVRRHLTIVPL